MNTNPASVHFRAKAEFSLSFTKITPLAHIFHPLCMNRTHKAISGVYPLTPFFLCNLYNAIPIEVGRDGSQVESKRGAQGMLRFTIWVCV